MQRIVAIKGGLTFYSYCAKSYRSWYALSFLNACDMLRFR